jgi:hypothetical protein
MSALGRLHSINFHCVPLVPQSLPLEDILFVPVFTSTCARGDTHSHTVSSPGLPSTAPSEPASSSSHSDIQLGSCPTCASPNTPNHTTSSRAPAPVLHLATATLFLRLSSSLVYPNFHSESRLLLYSLSYVLLSLCELLVAHLYLVSLACLNARHPAANTLVLCTLVL